MAISTKRPLSEILSLLVDNTTGNISEEDLRDSIKSVYGNKSITSVSADTTLGVDDIYVYVHDLTAALNLQLYNLSVNDGQDSTYVGKEYIVFNDSDKTWKYC